MVFTLEQMLVPKGKGARVRRRSKRPLLANRNRGTVAKGKFGNKCILSYIVLVQTIVSSYQTTDIDFLFWIIASFDLSFFL